MHHSLTRKSAFTDAKTLSAALAFLAIAMPSSAVIYTYDNGINTPDVSSIDLLQTSVASMDFGTPLFNAEGGGDPLNMTDGSGGAGAGNTFVSTGAVVGNSTNVNIGKFATYNFDLTGAGLEGYNITSIDIFSGWADPARDELNVEVLYSTVADPGIFISLAHPANNTSSDPDGKLSTTWISANITDETGTLATGVAAIQFNFNLPVENGYVGIREIDVFGTTVVPEPSSFVLLTGLMTLALGFSRRRVKR